MPGMAEGSYQRSRPRDRHQRRLCRVLGCDRSQGKPPSDEEGRRAGQAQRVCSGGSFTYKVDANLYYEDVDSKDQGKLKFVDNRYQGAGSYRAVDRRRHDNRNCLLQRRRRPLPETMEIKYVAIAVNVEDAVITNGETYSLNLAELNFPGNYKVRINGGAEQDAAESYTFTRASPASTTCTSTAARPKPRSRTTL